ncbi:MAG: nitroreductase family protein, partial [Acidimicrobiia bacterium]|nr:nitroreductase family protein [Acidimicrobiia bacterium]
DLPPWQARSGPSPAKSQSRPDALNNAFPGAFPDTGITTREVVGGFMLEALDRLEGTDHPRAKTVTSSAYLVEHLAEVPVTVIPTIVGRHDGSGAPGLFDSVIQSGWSFCVALRARGLGTAWTTAVLAKAPELKELLGIPDEITGSTCSA